MKKNIKTMKWQYKAEDDIWEWQRHNMTHRSASEAFRDAEYATAIYKPKSEWDDCMEFCGGMVLMTPVLLFVGYICYLIVKGV
jgi:hypothetical protein